MIGVGVRIGADHGRDADPTDDHGAGCPRVPSTSPPFLDDAAKRNVLGETARRVFRLD